MSVEIKDNSGAVKVQMQGNITKALTAMGQVGLELVNDQMMKGYGKPIYRTGDLIRSIAFVVNGGEQSVTWGTNLSYG